MFSSRQGSRLSERNSSAKLANAILAKQEITPDPPCLSHLQHPPLQPSLERSPQPRFISLSLCIDTHSFCCTTTNTNQLHFQAAPGLLHPTHRLLGGFCLCSARNASLLFSSLLGLPTTILFQRKWKKKSFVCCNFLLSVVAQLSCRSSSDFLSLSYKAQHYKLPYKPHTVQPYGPGGATADTTSTGCLMVPLAPAILLFQLSGSTRLCADIFCISYLTKINRQME